MSGTLFTRCRSQLVGLPRLALLLTLLLPSLLLAAPHDSAPHYSAPHYSAPHFAAPLPAAPLRVVTLSNDSTEALLALGLQPVGATRSLNGNPWYRHIAAQMSGVMVVGLENAPNLELIASLQPDLILGNRQQSARLLSTLERIAPTVLVRDSRKGWQQNFLTFSRALGQEAAAQARLARLQRQILCLRQALQQQPLRRISVLRFNPGQVRLYQLDSFSGELFAALGFSRPPNQNVHAYGVNNFSRERIAELDADRLFYFTYGARRQQSTLQYREAFMSDPAWQQLSVVRHGQVRSLDDVIWNTANGILAAEVALSQIPRLFSLPASEGKTCAATL